MPYMTAHNKTINQNSSKWEKKRKARKCGGYLKRIAFTGLILVINHDGIMRNTMMMTMAPVFNKKMDQRFSSIGAVDK